MGGLFPQAGCLLAFKVSVWAKAFPQELVGKYASLEKSTHDMMHFQINMSVVDLVGKAVLFHNQRGGKREWDTHIFVLVEGSGKVNFFDVKAHVLAIGHAEHTVPMWF